MLEFIMLLRPVVILFLLWVPAGAGANLITNGGFEDSVFTGWTTSGNPGVWGIRFAYPPHSGASGARIGAFHSADGVSQAITTVPGASYALDFWLFLSQNGSTPATFSASWDGTSIFSFSAISPNGFPYMHETFTNLTASTTLTSLSFSGQGAFSDQAFMLDDVNLVANSQTVPEPNTIGMLLGGLAVLGVVAHRKVLSR